MPTLTTTNHDRDSEGLTYVYPVISRRAGGLSIGVNLNPNNACNWRCVYCQVPDLRRGAAPEIDLVQLEQELRQLLDAVTQGDFYDRFQLAPEQRAIRDVAISGNGESTTCAQFVDAIGVIGQVAAEYELLGRIKLVLITNGSQMQKAGVQRGIAHWSELGGVVWFKLDSATEAGILRINNVSLSPASVRRNLETSARLCPTWIQTCLFALDGQPPAYAEQVAYLDLLAGLQKDGVAVEGVLLYGLARPSRQPEAPRLSTLPREWLDGFADRIRALGLTVRVHE